MIQTNWGGYRFRSRLEARWAVFFDRLALKFEYEPEGFKLSNGEWYLPDFRVTTDQGYVIWYEVKPLHTKSDPKFDVFAAETKDYAVRLSGDPVDVLASRRHVCPRCGTVGVDDYGTYFGCWPCDAGTPCGGDEPWEFGFAGLAVRPDRGTVDIAPLMVDEWDKFVRRATEHARGARFEHGETP